MQQYIGFYLKGDDHITASKSAQKAVTKYQKENYERVSVLLPKGTKEKISARGETVNGFINKAVAEKLEREPEESE